MVSAIIFLAEIGRYLGCILPSILFRRYQISSARKFSSFEEGPQYQSTPLGDMTGRIVFLSEAGVRVAVFPG
jgi:hypothetical protein